MAARKERKSNSTLTNFFLLLAVLAVFLALLYYRKDLRRLFRILFLIFLVAGTLISCRHIVFRLWRKASLHFRGPMEEEVPRPDLDQQKDLAVKRAQDQHDEKAEDFESRIGAPRRELKLKQSEEKMKFIRGFSGEGEVVGGSVTRGSTEARLRRLVHHETSPESHVTSPESHVTTSGSNVTSVEDHETSPDGHVTTPGDDATTEEDQVTSPDNHVIEDPIDDGERITISLRMPHKISRRRFRTTDKLQVLYEWAEGLGHTTSDHVLVTTLPRVLLEEREKTLEECGILTDTALVIEEKE